MAATISISRNFTSSKNILPDLTQNIRITEPENTIGFLTCDPETDNNSLLELLADKLNFPIVGGTTLDLPLLKKDDEISAQLITVEKSGLKRFICTSDILDESKVQPQMEDLYRRCLEGLGAMPKLFLLFFPLLPGINTDKFIKTVFALAGDIPVFGGVTSDDLDARKAPVFADGQVYFDRIVLVGLGGEINPVFSAGVQLTVISEYAPIVTKSRENVVYTVADSTFCDYMTSIGLDPADPTDNINSLFENGPLPVLLRNKITDDDGVPEIRGISSTNLEEGSAAFSADVPEGTRVGIGYMTEKDISDSTEWCVNGICGQIQEQTEQGYQFSVLLNVSCISRYFTMVGKENRENQIIWNAISKQLPISSFYAFGEIGPTKGSKGQIYNRSHSHSIVMCAF